ncbi:energy transducer TonB [Aquabacterium sp. A08]|nr:energy transducer TonB [Aquabacterium sp. A08]NIC42405.1 energy transducer TonB [Aquabacterium sp. A08]
MPARQLVVLAAVVAAHAGGLWLLQRGLVQRPSEAVVPAEILVEWVASAAPAAAPTPRPQAPAPRPPVPPTPAPTPRPAPPARPAAAPSPVVAPVSDTPSPPTALAEAPAPAAVPAAPAPSAPPAATAAGPATPAAPRIELPSANADYLNNPRPAYPPLSKRLGEQGKVVLRVFIEVDGRASQAEIRTSSGYDRLDQTALQTVLRWRYVPGKRNGVAEAMWFNVPINFVLE